MCFYRNLLAGIVLYLILVVPCRPADAQNRPASAELQQLRQRLEAAEERIEELESQGESQSSRSRSGVKPAFRGDGAEALPSRNTSQGPPSPIQKIFYQIRERPEFDSPRLPGPAPVPEFPKQRFAFGYDGGFYIRPTEGNEDAFPFALQINGRMQFRWSGFKRNVDSFTDRAGNTIPVESRNDFEVERGRLEFEGYFLDPNLEYYINFDADTDDNHNAKFHDFWVNYKFHDWVNLHVGKAKVPGSYEWLQSSSRFRFADRSLSTTFFRPDRSVGVWSVGQLDHDITYYAMIANGLRSTDLENEDVDDLFIYSLMTWWDGIGEIGRGYSDLENHQAPAARLGHAFTFGNQNEGSDDRVLPEAQWVRLSDGTRLTTTGALGPGVTVNGFDFYLYSLFFVAKYQRWSANGEVYFRWLENFDTAGGPAAPSDFFTKGFYTDLGYMIIPEKLELIGRISNIDGFFGDSWEYAGGATWFFDGHGHKVTFDVSMLDGSPTGSSSPNFAVGQDGVLFRTQYQAAF